LAADEAFGCGDDMGRCGHGGDGSGEMLHEHGIHGTYLVIEQEPILTTACLDIETESGTNDLISRRAIPSR
jgi:hypothetical protein